MLFNSREFLIFFPVVVALYFVLPHRLRWLVLLIASYVFYMSWRVEYGLLLLLTTCVAYGGGLAMGRARSDRQRTTALAVSLAVPLGALFLYKYANFFGGAVNDLLAVADAPIRAPVLDLILPIGISFYTFQTLSYTIDVYRRRRSPERHFGIFGLYVSFFPQLVAGPIERSTTLLPQLRQKFDFDRGRVVAGLRLMLWGFFKKMAIADNLAPVVNKVHAQPDAYTGLPLLIATVLFAIQIYCDFSGYAHIAIGAAKVLGFRLTENFEHPYGAASIAEFWRKWHISLSTWFRDYVFIPLGGSRTGVLRHGGNILAVFLISGLWHGANWTFLIWGALHGLALVVSVWTATWRRRLGVWTGLARMPTTTRLASTAATLGFVCFAWIFFRAESVEDAFYISAHLFDGISDQLFDGLFWSTFSGTLNMSETGLAVACLAAGAVFFRHLVWAGSGPSAIFARLSRPGRWAVYYGMIFGILFFGQVDEQEFIYFQF